MPMSHQCCIIMLTLSRDQPSENIKTLWTWREMLFVLTFDLPGHHSRATTCCLQQFTSHMFIYARSEQCELGPIYTITNTQRTRIYPGKLKFILVKISPDLGRLHGKHAKENQTLSTFLTAENLSGLPCSHSANMEHIQICPVML